jgi:hypothetical protein
VQNIVRSPSEFLLSLRASFLDVVVGSFDLASVAAVVVALVLIVAAYALFSGRVRDDAVGGGGWPAAARRLLLGVLFFYLGVLPYLAIGREGRTFGSEWESRDQLLLGIGAAFILFYGLTLLFDLMHAGAWIRQLVFAVLVACFVLANVTMYLQFQADWFKQAGIIEHMRGETAIRDNTTFAVEDRIPELNAMNRHVQFYEYTGMLVQAFGTRTRLAAPASDISAFSNPAFLALCVERAQYNLQDYKAATPSHLIVIDRGKDRSLGLAAMGKLITEELLNPAAFRARAKELVSMKVEPL